MVRWRQGAKRACRFWRLRTSVPDFERSVVRTGHNRLSVGREGHGADPVAVCAALLALQLQRVCVGGRSKSVLTGSGRFWRLHTCVPDFIVSFCE